MDEVDVIAGDRGRLRDAVYLTSGGKRQTCNVEAAKVGVVGS